MPIELDDQTNNTPFPPPTFLDWNFAPNGATVFYYQGGALPEPITIQTRFKDVAVSSTIFQSLKYKAFVDIESNVPEFVLQSGPLHTGANIYQNYTTGMNQPMVYTFQNINLLPPGGYLILCRHRIYGVNNGIYNLISEKTLNMQLLVMATGTSMISPSSLNFSREFGQDNDITIPITMTGTFWQLQCPSGFLFTDIDDVLITELPNGGYNVAGVGTKTFALVCTASVAPETIVQNPLHFTLTGNAGTIQCPITVTFITGSGMFLSRNSLNFIAYKGIQEANPQYIQMSYPSGYTFVCPPWLYIMPSFGNGTFNAGFFPITTDNLDAGQYTGVVEIRHSDTNALLGEVNIVYVVVDSIHSPYESGYAFTLDPKYFELVSQNDNTFFELLMTATVYDFYTLNTKVHQLNFKYPLLNRRQKFNIGQVIHRLMSNLPSFEESYDTPYNPAEISLRLTEKSLTNPDFSQVSELQFSYVAGIEPPLVNGSGFLDLNAGASRVTPEGYFYLNILISGYPTLRILKNGETVNYYGLTSGIHSSRIDLSNYNAAQGDEFEFKLEASSGQISKKLRVMPEGRRSNFIVWENEYKLRSVMEFTGEYSLKTEFENRNQTLYEQLVDVIRKMESRKTVKLTINTGWLLKTDILSVESLCRARRAALVMPGKIINLVPGQKSIVNIDSDQGLVSFDVEFDVNRNFNEEIYSF